jgi:hypothetical protein
MARGPLAAARACWPAHDSHGPAVLGCSPRPGRRGPAHSGSHNSRPRPGRNLGLGRESGHPPGPLLARQCAAVDLNRTDERAFREDKTVAASASHQTLAHFSFPFLFAFWRRKQQRAAAMVTVRAAAQWMPHRSGRWRLPFLPLSLLFPLHSQHRSRAVAATHGGGLEKTAPPPVLSSARARPRLSTPTSSGPVLAP